MLAVFSSQSGAHQTVLTARPHTCWMPWREWVLRAVQDEEVPSAAACAPHQTARQDV